MIFRSGKSYENEIVWLRAQLEKSQERIDRLTEALSYKVNVPLVMPQTPLPQIPQSPSPEIKAPGGWWDTKPIPAVIQKPSGGNSK